MADFKCEVLKVFGSSEPDAKGNRLDLRVVKWGENGKPVLEKRRMWKDEETGEDRARKMVGMNLDDLLIINEHMDEVRRLLEGGDNG
jgi:hypothetical protein